MISTSRKNRSVGIGLIVSGVAFVVGGLVISLFITAVVGGNRQLIATGALATGGGMFIAGILNVLTGKNLAEMKLLPDTASAGPLMLVVIVLVKMLIFSAIFIVMGWLALKYLA